MPDANAPQGAKQAHPLADPAEAAKLLGALRSADHLVALKELSGWLEQAKELSEDEEKTRCDILAALQDAAEPHVAALVGQIIGHTAASQAARETRWTQLNDFLRGLTGALFASAARLIKASAENAALQPVAAAAAVRTLHACRHLAKSYLLHYMSVPPKVWRLAYALHASAEDAGCAGTAAAAMHGTHKASSTANVELLRLLMLQTASPDLLPPEQIEAADRVIEHIGGEFTLRAPGASDNPFLFHPASDHAPQRAPATPPPADQGYRYFGPGAAYGALETLAREFAQPKAAQAAAFGRDIPFHAQAAAIRHLYTFWGAANPYSPPARTPASGTLKVAHGFGPAWQQVSGAGGGKMELSLVETNEKMPAPQEMATDDWALKDTGGNELGAEVPPSAAEWARCGTLIAVTRSGEKGCSLGVIRSLHFEPEQSLLAHIAILSSAPRAVRLMPINDSKDAVYSAAAMRQFASFGGGVRAIILSDGSGAGAQKPNLMLPADQWHDRREYEVSVGNNVRLLRSGQVLRRGDDFVRATFEWLEEQK
ncbi:MAG TPA: hypothetical protein VEH51_02735 [Burkholderiales bacterium]|nr:hypothetical protein [Burkholderiales bacterium]